jgi:hypothetical protein
MARKPVTFHEGTLKKGGLNPPPTSYRPPPPQSFTPRPPSSTAPAAPAPRQPPSRPNGR